MTLKTPEAFSKIKQLQRKSYNYFERKLDTELACTILIIRGRAQSTDFKGLLSKKNTISRDMSL
jgi:hypothetical protein